MDRRKIERKFKKRQGTEQREEIKKQGEAATERETEKN